MIVATEAVVLHSRKQGDTSKIVALYTRDFGLIDVIAKGARQQRSKFAGALELFSSSKIVFYKKEHQELYLLSTAEIVASRRHISDDLERIEAATRIAELLIRSQHHEESHPELFELVTTTLDAIDSSDNTERLQSLRFWFFLKYAEFTGFALR